MATRKRAGDQTERITALAGVDKTPVSPTERAGVPGTPIIAGYIQSKERNPKLFGLQRYETLENILFNVGIVAASVRYFLNLVASASFTVAPRDEEGAASASEYLEFVEDSMDNLTVEWPRIIRKAAFYKFHGFGLQEWTAVKQADGKIGFAAIEPRPQHTIVRWDQGAGGEILGVTQRNPVTGREQYLPRQKLIYCVDDTMTDSPEGLGWGRNVVDPAERIIHYKQLEAYSFERNFAGVPIARAPLKELQDMIATGDPAQKQAAEAAIAMIQKFVTMEVRKPNTGLILSSETYPNINQSGEQQSPIQKWGLDMLQGHSEGLHEIQVAIDREMHDCARVIGTQNLLIGASGKGSQALSTDQTENVLLGINQTKDEIAAAFSRDYIEPLWILNGFPDEFRPKLKADDVGFADAAKMAAALRDLATAGAMIEPDDPAINDVRDAAGLTSLNMKQVMQRQQLRASLATEAGLGGMQGPAAGSARSRRVAGGKGTKAPAGEESGDSGASAGDGGGA